MITLNLISHEIIPIMISMTILVLIKAPIDLIFVTKILHIGRAIFSKSLIHSVFFLSH